MKFTTSIIDRQETAREARIRALKSPLGEARSLKTALLLLLLLLLLLRNLLSLLMK